MIGTNQVKPNIDARPWNGLGEPKRILVIRLQALGDVVITFPYLLHLRNSLSPAVRFDFLTRAENEEIARDIILFDKVYSIGGGRNSKKQFIAACVLMPKLMKQQYDVVIDLQNNFLSRIVRKSIRPKAWSAFDRFSPIAAGERNRLTIEAVGLGINEMNTSLRLKDEQKGIDILKDNGWNGRDALVILNPAGAFETRNWKIENYVRFSQLWLECFPDTRFLIMGTSMISEKAASLQLELRDRLINLVNKTSLSQAFAILQHAKLVLSEDSGLMHMAWISGIPTLTLFGGTRSDWSRPLGEHSFFLDSSDLPCGNCMQMHCRYGDVHCLARYTPEMVFNYATALLQKLKKI